MSTPLCLLPQLFASSGTHSSFLWKGNEQRVQFNTGNGPRESVIQYITRSQSTPFHRAIPLFPAFNIVSPRFYHYDDLNLHCYAVVWKHHHHHVNSTIRNHFVDTFLLSPLLSECSFVRWHKAIEMKIWVNLSFFFSFWLIDRFCFFLLLFVVNERICFVFCVCFNIVRFG